MFAWDENKRAANLAKHGIDFSDAEHFNFLTALISVDMRKDYGEQREVALGYIKERLHVLVFSRGSEGFRLISLRKANAKERTYYATQNL